MFDATSLSWCMCAVRLVCQALEAFILPDYFTLNALRANIYGVVARLVLLIRSYVELCCANKTVPVVSSNKSTRFLSVHDV